MRARDRDRPACTLSCSRGFFQGLRDLCFESLVTRVDHGDQRSVLPPQCVMGFGILESHFFFFFLESIYVRLGVQNPHVALQRCT